MKLPKYQPNSYMDIARQRIDKACRLATVDGTVEDKLVEDCCNYICDRNPRLDHLWKYGKNRRIRKKATDMLYREVVCFLSLYLYTFTKESILYDEEEED